jgi:signal transduction histidine kinase
VASQRVGGTPALVSVESVESVETGESLDDLRRLTIATRDLCGLLDVSFLVKKASRSLSCLLGTDVAGIALRTGDTAVRSVNGAGCEAGIRLRAGGIGGRVLAGGQPVTVADFQPGASGADDFVDVVLVEERVRAAAVTPVTAAGTVAGVVFCGNRDPGHVGRRVVTLLAEFAASVAPVVMTALRVERVGEMAVAEERQRIAQQLHDTTGPILFNIGLAARRLQEGAGESDGGPVSTVAREIEVGASEAARCLREAFRSTLALSNEEALPVTVRRDAHAFSRRTDNPVEMVVVGQPFVTSAAVDGAILAVVREGLHNVEKHAGPASVALTLCYREEGEVRLVIQDDGRGLPADFSLQPVPGKAGGLGLPGLRQRVEGLGGDLRVGGNEDGGLSLRVGLPVPAGAQP